MTTALRVFDTAPSADDYTSLQSHQEQTPGSFFGGKPVLHHHGANAVLKTTEQEVSTNPALSALRASSDDSTAPATSNGDDAAVSSEVSIPGIDVWVTSEFFCLWSSATSKGVQIPYQTISLHARQQTALYMQLCLSDISQTADDDLETVELLLQPAGNDTEAAEQLYSAVSACADLHPDPDDDEEGEPEPEPGAGGWITSENMHEFVDEDGNFRMPEGGLVSGAGTIRTADQFEDAEAGDERVDGEGESDETKWRRTG